MDDHNWMMSKATVLYSRAGGELDRDELARLRVLIAEALVGEWIERRWNRRQRRKS